MTFTEYLEQKHSQLNPMVLDDDLPDSFDSWMSELEQDDLLTYGTDYGNEMFDAGKNKFADKKNDNFWLRNFGHK